MEFVKQHLSLYLIEIGVLFVVLIVAIILQILISKQQFLRPYRLVGLMANMIGSLVLSIWGSAVALTFFEELVKEKGIYAFYVDRILPYLLGAWVVYLFVIIMTHMLTIVVEEHKIYKKSEENKANDSLKSEFVQKPDWK